MPKPEPFNTARSLLARLKAGEISSVELCEATLDRIDATNPAINAIVSLADRSEVLAAAAQADAEQAAGKELGQLHGLPMAIKDLADVVGFRTSQGSTVTPDKPAQIDSLFVSRLRSAGVIFVAKTNVPEFGTGSHTFNEVFGVTRNPYDPTRSAGGSSGGAAAALASGMVDLADGSDLGGSLRNPAAFNNVVGFRPTIGRVPRLSDESNFYPRFGLEGPMARTVDDVALLLSVMAGPDRRDPRSIAELGSQFGSLAPLELGGLRVAWADDLGLPFEKPVLDVCRSAMSVLEDAGSIVAGRAPDLAGAMDVFFVNRGIGYRALGSQVPTELHAQLKETVRWNIEYGENLTVDDIVRAETERTRLHNRLIEFFDEVDIWAMPTSQVLPFPVELEYPTEIDGKSLTDYLEWMTSCCIVTATGCPAISVPAGFSDSGLPVGLQLIAAPGDDLKLLRVAAAFEAHTQHHLRRPAVSV